MLAEYSPRGVVAYRDEDIVPISLMAQALGLDYHAPEVARTLVDKLLQREALRKGGLPTPDFWEVPCRPRSLRCRGTCRDRAVPGGAEAADREWWSVHDARRGCRPSHTVESRRSRRRRGERRACSSSSTFRARRPGPTERFADYVSVESLVSHGRISHFAVTGRFPLAEPFRETGFFIPADISPAQLKSVLESATGALRALGVRTGDFHTEIKLTPDGPRVLEVNGRLGGGVPEMLFEASGESLMRLSMRVALGEEIAVDGPIRVFKGGLALLVPGTAVGASCRQHRRPGPGCGHRGVSSVFLNREPGTPIDLWDGTRHYIYSVYGVSEDYEGLLEIDRFLHEEVAIVYE